MTASHIAVFQCKVGSHEVLAWCFIGSGAGFESIEYTELDGFSPANISEAPALSQFLFVAPLAEVPPKGESFRAEVAPPARSDLIGSLGIPAGDAD